MRNVLSAISQRHKTEIYGSIILCERKREAEEARRVCNPFRIGSFVTETNDFSTTGLLKRQLGVVTNMLVAVDKPKVFPPQPQVARERGKQRRKYNYCNGIKSNSVKSYLCIEVTSVTSYQKINSLVILITNPISKGKSRSIPLVDYPRPFERIPVLIHRSRIVLSWDASANWIVRWSYLGAIVKKQFEKALSYWEPSYSERNNSPSTTLRKFEIFHEISIALIS